MPATTALGDRVVAEGAEVDVRERSERSPAAAGPWMATSDVASERSSRTALRAVEAGCQLVRDDRGVPGVGDDEETLLGEPVDDEIVDDPAIRGAQHRVLGPPDGERPGIRHDGRGERVPGPRPLDEQLAHVRQVEQAGPLADRPVLLEDPGVLHGHQPAAELDELRAERAVHVGQGGLVQRRRLGVRHPGVAPGFSAGPVGGGRSRARGPERDRRGLDQRRARSRRSAGSGHPRTEPSGRARTRDRAGRGRRRRAP